MNLFNQRGKNKELESRCNDAEKRLAEERTSREEAEAKVRSLKRRLKEIKESSGTKETNDDDNEKQAMNQTVDSPAISYTNSPIGLNCINLPTEESSDIEHSEKAMVDAIAESLTSVDLNS
jgi:ribosome assembly protein YihI (activator of Der GTPase)